MVGHDWSEKDFDWKALDDAGLYLSKRCRQFGRLGIWTKEKWGILRVEDTCAWWSSWPIHGIVYPGHAFYRWPKWMIKYIEYPLWEMFSFLRITKAVNWYQLQVLKFFWKRAAKKWPHIAEEILAEYEWVTED